MLRVVTLSLAIVVASCAIGVSAASTLPVPGAYCEPISADVLLCRADDETTWRCVATEWSWRCEVLP